MKRCLLFIALTIFSFIPSELNAAHPASPDAERKAWARSMADHLNGLGRAEKKELKLSIRSEILAFKQKRKINDEADTKTLLLTLIALILPPLAVYLHQGVINSKFWISLLLTLLIWVPGVIYALLVIFNVID